MILSVLILLASLQTTPGIVLPGVLDLPIIEPATTLADCGPMLEGVAASGKPYQCLGATIENGQGVINAYIAEAKTRGWVSLGAAANAFNLQRPLPDGGCQGMVLAGFPGAATMNPSDPAIILIAVDPATRCLSPRPAQ